MAEPRSGAEASLSLGSGGGVCQAPTACAFDVPRMFKARERVMVDIRSRRHATRYVLCRWAESRSCLAASCSTLINNPRYIPRYLSTSPGPIDNRHLVSHTISNTRLYPGPPDPTLSQNTSAAHSTSLPAITSPQPQSWPPPAPPPSPCPPAQAQTPSARPPATARAAPSAASPDSGSTA